MGYIIVVTVVMLIHLAFVLFVIFGALVVLKRRWVALLHIPAAVWGILIEFRDWICPLTPWENQLRQLGHQSGYSGGFIEHYLLAIIYPSGLTRDVQIIFGSLVLGLNLCLYAWIIVRRVRKRRKLDSSGLA